MTGTDPGADHRDGTDAATARMLFAGTAAAVVLRGLTWAFSSLAIGPLLGAVGALLGAVGSSKPVLFVQAVLTVAAVVVAVVCAAGLRDDPQRFRRPVRLLSYVFIADVVLYLAPIVVLVAINPGLSGSAWLLFAVATVGNLALAWLALLIVRRTGPARTVPAA
jgi:hypothetical protein